MQGLHPRSTSSTKIIALLSAQSSTIGSANATCAAQVPSKPCLLGLLQGQPDNPMLSIMALEPSSLTGAWSLPATARPVRSLPTSSTHLALC